MGHKTSGDSASRARIRVASFAEVRLRESTDARRAPSPLNGEKVAEGRMRGGHIQRVNAEPWITSNFTLQRLTFSTIVLRPERSAAVSKTSRSKVKDANAINGPALLRFAVCLLALWCSAAPASFVYQTPSEFLTSADVNGDGRADVIVLDRATGNVRVGYQDATGALSWSSAIPTGVPGAAGFTTGRFLASDREAIAVTSPELNRVQFFNLTDQTTAALAAMTLTPTGIGPSMLIGLRAPQGTTSSRDPLWVSSNQHDPGRTFAELFGFSVDAPFLLLPGASHSGPSELGNSMQFGDGPTTYASTIVRGSNDTFRAYAFTNGIAAFLTRSNLPAGTEYVFGRFNNGTYPRFLFYVPGESNIAVHALINVGGTLQIGPPTVTAFTAAVHRVFYLDEGTNGLAVIHFGDAVAGARLPIGDNTLQEQYRFAVSGNVASGVLPLGNNRFALLSRSSNSTFSANAQVFTKSGANYSQTSSSAMPRVTSNSTRANVWLFATEPFVNLDPLFVSSVNGGDWIAALSGLPGSLLVTTETDRGTTPGLGNPTNQTLALPPSTVQFGIANQYHPGISLFSYSSTRAPEPVLIHIAPTPGHYESGINISFTTSNAGANVYYRVGPTGLYQPYSTPVPLSSNATVQYYGIASGGARSSVQVASYTFTDNAPPSLVTTNGSGTNNIPPGGTINTSGVPVNAYGTVVYSRMTDSNGAIWMVNLDGTSDRYITQGTRPRLSPDGRYLAFLREGDPYSTIPYNNGNIWVRDLLAGNEWRLITHTNVIYWYDWGYRTNLYFDQGCGIFVTDLNGNVSQLPVTSHCSDDAPAVNPVDGTLAFHNAIAVADTNSGLFITDPALTTKIRITNALVPHWPSWSPDGKRIAFASYYYTYIPEGGMNLAIANADGSGSYQLTGFAHGSGFRNGAMWSPAGDALIGAGTMFGTNGIWVLPLSQDGTRCEGTPWRIPITPGVDYGVDFVGSVYVPPGPPRLSIRRNAGDVTVYWRRTAWPYVLETTASLGPNAIWTPVAPPYGVLDGNFIFNLPAPSTVQYFRLRLP
jgi:hypothetical protein